MNNKNDSPESNRRDFLKNTSLATMMAMMGGVELRADDAAKTTPAPDNGLTKMPPRKPINIGVIGLGGWGRDILEQLHLLNTDPARDMKDSAQKKDPAPVVAICDTYHAAVRKALKDTPSAQPYEDYTKLLADPKVQAVIIATPTGTHKQIVLDALAAGKHVYCEVPLANTIEDAKIIAKAGRDAVKLVFQPGL